MQWDTQQVSSIQLCKITKMFTFCGQTDHQSIKVEGAYRSAKRTHLRATERHLPYGITKVTCHPTQVNTLCLNPRQAGQYLKKKKKKIFIWLKQYDIQWYKWQNKTNFKSQVARKPWGQQFLVYHETTTTTTILLKNYLQINKYRKKLLQISRWRAVD